MKKILFILFALLVNVEVYAQCNNTTITPTGAPASPQMICEGDPVPSFSATCAGDCLEPCTYDAAACSVTAVVEICHSYIGDLDEWHLVGPGGIDIQMNGGNPSGSGTTGNGGACADVFNGGSDEIFIFTFDSESANAFPNGAPTSGTTYTMDNETGLNGGNISAAGWGIQIYDCVGSDDGQISSVTLNFNCPSCTPSTVTYTLTTPAEISDNTCTVGTAAIVIVPPLAVPEQVWYTDATGGTALNGTDAAYTPTDTAPGTYDYYVQCACGPNTPVEDCASPRTQVDLIIVDVPTISAAGSCTADAPGNGEIVITEGAAAINGSWQYSIDGGATWMPSGTFSSLANGTYPVAISNTLDPTCIVTDDAIIIDCQEPPCDAQTGSF